MEKWASLALIFLVISTVYPKPAAAQGTHSPELVKQVSDLFAKLGLTVLEREVWLSSLRGIKLPSGWEILNHLGGEAAVRQMLRGWGLSEDVIDEVIASLSTNAPVDRRVDLKIAVRGKPAVSFLVEIKSTNDFVIKHNIVRTVHEALYDAFLAEKGDPVVWVTQGDPGKGWARKMLSFLRGRGVGVTTSVANDAAAADALDAVSRRVYKIPLGQLIKDLASRIRQARLDRFLRENPEVAAFIALVGAEVAVSLWQPSEPWQAELKMVIQDALRAIGMGYAAIATVEGLMSLGLAIALSSGAGAAAAALALVPTIAVRAYAVAAGQQPSPRVYAVEREVEGVRVRVVVIDPPDPLAPRRVVVFVNGYPRLAANLGRGAPRLSSAEAARSAFAFSSGGKAYSVGLGWDGVYAAVRWVVESSSRAGSCTVARRHLYERTWTVRYSEVVAGRNPQPQLRITLLGSSTTCRPQLQPQPQPQPQPPPARPSLTGGGLCCGRSIVDI